MYEFKRTTSAFNYLFERNLQSGEEIIVKIPDISPNKRSINDIGWQSDTDDEIVLYATLSDEPESDNAIWQEIGSMCEINKTVSALKVVNVGTARHKILMRIIYN